MADFLSLTGPEIRFNGATSLDLTQAIDVLDYDTLSVVFFSTALVGTGTPSYDVEIWTGMQTDAADDWVKLTTTTINGTGPRGSENFASGGFQRYLGWRVGSVATLTDAGLCIRVVARKNTLAYF